MGTGSASNPIIRIRARIEMAKQLATVGTSAMGSKKICGQALHNIPQPTEPSSLLLRRLFRILGLLFLAREILGATCIHQSAGFRTLSSQCLPRPP